MSATWLCCINGGGRETCTAERRRVGLRVLGGSAHSCRISWSQWDGRYSSLVVAPAGQQSSMRQLLLEFLVGVVVLLCSTCHDSHVVIAVEWKTRWKSTSAKVITEGGILAQRRRFCCYRPAVGLRRWRSTGSDGASCDLSIDDACCTRFGT